MCPFNVKLFYKQCYACQFVQYRRQCTVRIFPDGLITLDVVQYVGDSKSDMYHVWNKKVSSEKTCNFMRGQSGLIQPLGNPFSP